MKIAVLTTETTHHAHFVRELAASDLEVEVFCETRSLAAPFETAHAFEAERDAYERDVWFGGRQPSLGDFAPTRIFPSMNDDTATDALARSGADMVVVFGTGLLQAKVIAAGPACFLNLHGGNPEEYRGLDSHLWAIYHGDAQALVTTLHRVNTVLDDGEIALQASVPTEAGMPLARLRSANTETCISLALAAADQYKRSRTVLTRPQRNKGRYYSFMPAALKQVCVGRFEQLTQSRGDA